MDNTLERRKNIIKQYHAAYKKYYLLKRLLKKGLYPCPMLSNIAELYLNRFIGKIYNAYTHSF